jgi:hypothetical protein
MDNGFSFIEKLLFIGKQSGHAALFWQQAQGRLQAVQQ